MTTDAWLAIAHHLAALGVLVVLSVEWAIVRPGLDASDLRRLVRVDSAYGLLAAAVLAAGVARVVAGAQPADFYLENPVFWAKMAAFATVGGLSVRPTIRYLGWRKALDGTGALPEPAELSAAGRAVLLQLVVFFTIPVLAALMARGIGS